jgi:chaperonin GroES
MGYSPAYQQPPQGMPPQMPEQGMMGAQAMPQDIGQQQQEQIDPAMIPLLALAALPNIIDHLPKAKTDGIASTVIEEYELDDKSREFWKTSTKKAMDLAMLVSEPKTYPWTNAANIKYPLLTTAALQFNARAYPAIVQGSNVVKCKVWGNDDDGQKAARAERVSEHLSYQLLELPEWEEDTDKLLVILPIVGCAFRKIFYDPSLSRNSTRLVTADRLVVNYWARSLEDAPRVTEEMHLYPYEIEERIRSGRFIKFDYSQAVANALPTDTKDKDDKRPDEQDRDAPHLFLEQHRLLDLDDDGYSEPYIVTVHHSSATVVRIVANYDKDTISIQDGKVAAIRKQQYYVKYMFLPAPDGGFYGLGFGWLLNDIGEAINTSTNQQLDAATVANVQGGLVSDSLGIKERKITLAPGEWKVIKSSGRLQDNVMPINYPGPSQASFNLLEFLLAGAKEIASIKDVLTGEGMGKNASPTTTMAMIEQGLQVFTAIYKRIHRSLKTELGIHARLNRKNLDPQRYNQFFDDQQQQFDPKVDYNEQDCDILPVSDPNNVSKMQKLAKAQFIEQTIAADESGVLNKQEGYKRLFEAADIEDVEKLFNPPQQPTIPEELMDLTKRAAMPRSRTLRPAWQ